MWDWVNCVLLGRHENAVWCERGAIRLRCLRCGHESHGWEVGERPPAMVASAPRRRHPFLHLLPRRQN